MSRKNIENIPIIPSFGEHVRKLRTEQHMSLRELAEASGFSATHVQRIECGMRRVDSLDVIYRLAGALHAPAEDFLCIAAKDLVGTTSFVRMAFPGINSDHQEQTVCRFAQLVSSADMTDEQLDNLLFHVTAFAEYCKKTNSGTDSDH